MAVTSLVCRLPGTRSQRTVGVRCTLDGCILRRARQDGSRASRDVRVAVQVTLFASRDVCLCGVTTAKNILSHHLSEVAHF